MESLGDTLWDVIICGTGLKQSLLALSLSRSGKNILHLDPNEYYGGPEAAFGLAEADAWAAGLSQSDQPALFRNASVTRSDRGAASLGPARQYSLALAPQFIHSRSALVSQLVSSRAYRQVEFLAVGSFFILKSSGEEALSLNRIPSTREDVFSSTAIPLRAKRSLMKFLKFVLEQQATPNSDQAAASTSEERANAAAEWAEKPLVDFLQAEFKLDADLQAYILALTLSLDAQVSTKEGLAAIYRHTDSMGVFGPGFAAVYPKWGGLSEIAQVACRAGAVGGGVYMLGTGIAKQKPAPSDSDGHNIELQLTNGENVKTKLLVSGEESGVEGSETTVSRLVAVVASPLASLFTATVEGATRPAVAVVALPRGLASTAHDSPVYAFVHSSDTGECPIGQSTVYLTTVTRPNAKAVLEAALSSFLAAVAEGSTTDSLYQLYYEQSTSASARDITSSPGILSLSATPVCLAFDDGILDSVRKTWEVIMGAAVAETEFMVFEDREGADEDDDVYD
ncbi:hypothetical protein GQ53DRAFT_353049 [Thozetella sp. PMI_491]|nr:hypothetical protein GQ53DRAFT_353049 [Thozetella sp. PMI_491]